jgi:UDP-glucose 4-epimerase
MAKILVTGGAGFVGQHVVKMLLDLGQQVVVLDDFSNSKRESVPHGPMIEVIAGNVADEAMVKKAMDGVDHVVHLAALVSVPLSVDEPVKTFESNVLGTEMVMKTARTMGLKGKLIYASSAAVYGGLELAKAREGDAHGVPLMSPYAASKVTNEIMGKMYRDVYGLRTIGLRFFNIYGPGQNASSPYSGVLSRVVHSVETGELFTIYGDGKQTRDFVAVADVVTVIKGLLAKPQDEDIPAVMNLGSGIAVSVLDMIRQVVALKVVNPRVEYRPARSGDVRLSCADVSLLKSVLPEWQPMTLQMGLRKWLL